MICEKIRAYLDDQEINYQEIGKALQIDDNECEMKLCGKVKITAEEYYIICRTLNVDLNFFHTNT